MKGRINVIQTLLYKLHTCRTTCIGSKDSMIFAYNIIINYIPVPDRNLCSDLDPCVAGNCTNTGPDSYHCGCELGYHGVNCSEEIAPGKPC